MSNYEFTPLARADVFAIWKYIAFDSIDAADRVELRKELHHLHVEFDEKETFNIRLRGRSAHEVVRLLGTPLTQMRTRTRSLEDAYLGILSEEADE